MQMYALQCRVAKETFKVNSTHSHTHTQLQLHSSAFACAMFDKYNAKKLLHTFERRGKMPTAAATLSGNVNGIVYMEMRW